jgi:D-alanyl-D-alanine carboxypeptidase
MIAEVAKEREHRRDDSATEDDTSDDSAAADHSSDEDASSDDDRTASAGASGESWGAKAEALHDPQFDRHVPRPVERPLPAYVASTPVSASSDTTTGSIEGEATADAATTTPSALHWVKGPAPADTGPSDSGLSDQALAAAGIEVKSDSRDDEAEAPRNLPPGWMIQIGATDDAAQADALLARAKARRVSALSDAKPFTQKVKKGDATLYRARFAGLDADDAQAACRSLKRSGFACFAMKN